MSEQRSACVLKPGLKITIKRRPIVLIEDLVGAQFPEIKDVVPLSYQKNTAIFCSLKNLQQARETFPDLPAYGIWQLIFESQRHFPERLYAVYFDDERQNGQFLLKVGDGFVSGKIAHGRALDVTVDVDLQTARTIMLSPAELHLPAAPALTPQERDQLGSQHKKKTMYAATAGLSIGVLLFTSVSYWLDGYQSQHEEEKRLLSSEIEALEERRDELAASRVKQWPEQWQVLYPLARLAYEGVRFSVWGLSLEQPVLRTRLLPDSGAEQASVPAWMQALPEVRVKRQIDGSAQVSWANYQGGEE